MTAPQILALAIAYVVGCVTSFLIHMFETKDGYQLCGRIFLWPLFIIKAAVVMCHTAYLDLAGKL